MVGKTVREVVGLDLDASEFHFVTTDGHRFEFYHEQDCCEHVRVVDVCGDLDDLLGHSMLQAEEVSNGDETPPSSGFTDDSQTWTFYKFGTIKGSVTVRWLGESNGYYSETVSYRHLDANGERQDDSRAGWEHLK
jgi:hypothetical protein